jgi:hypothetical protein
LVVTGSHSGCGFHVTRSVYNYDSKTGESIDINKIFGSDGEVKLLKLLLKQWKEKLKAAQASEDRYKECIEDPNTITAFSIENINRYLIGDHSISFWAGQCLDGSEAEYDHTVGPHVLSLGQLLPMLTPYGFSLFVDKWHAPMQTLLRGTIDGKYPISLTLKDGGSADTIGGMIVYDRVGEPINLGGTVNGTQFTLHELDASNNPLSDINVSWDGSKLTGTFTNLKSKKQMSFVASLVK